MEERVRIGEIDLAYEVFDGGPEPIVLVMGLGTSMLGWRDDFCSSLADRGYRVVRFDNRDIGRSTRIDAAAPGLTAMLARVTLGRPLEVPYRLSDMASDTIGLMDHLDIDRATVAGVSMGGMIAQTMAIAHPERVKALASWMSTTGERHLVTRDVRALRILTLAPSKTREEAQDRIVELFSLLQGAHDWDEDALRAYARRVFDRAIGPSGTARQLAAIVASGNRARGLRALKLPAWVVHGTMDPLIPPRAGVRTAELLDNARLTLLEGMGHDLHPHFWPQLIDGLTELAAS